MKPDDIRYFDVHSHLNFPQFEADREAIITEMAAEKIATITVGTGLATSREAVVLAERHEHLFAAVGIHPLEAKHWAEELTGLAGHERVVAIGECGLDYSRTLTKDDQKLQRNIFEQHIDLASALDKPLIIHCRDAYDDALDILRTKQQEVGERMRGDFHFFTSPVDTAKKCLDIGFNLSFTGPITFTSQYDEVVRYVPLERMMIETDAPYAAPRSHRGQRNSPLYVGEVAAKISALKGVDLDIVEKTLVKNAFELFLRKNVAKF